MKLTRVTITGADDEVDPDDLNKLSERYPFVEWGILASASRMGSPRYPTPQWIERRAAPVLERRSLHLCGALSRRALAGLHLPSEWPWYRWPRVQLNGFGAYRLPMLALAALNPNTEFILQVQDNAALLHASDLYKHQSNLSALWDLSGGEGKPIQSFPATGLLPMGFAGGVGPDNVVVIADYITTKLGEPKDPTWIDMESSVRTDDRFDLDKVRSVLDSVGRFVSTS